MVPYAAVAFATGGICLLYLGLKIITNRRHIIQLVQGTPEPEFHIRDEDLDALFGDDEDEEEYYEAQDENQPATGILDDRDRSSGDAFGKTLCLNPVRIGSTKSKQSLVSCQSCLCCRVRKFMSVIFPSDDDVNKYKRQTIHHRDSISEPSVGYHRD